MTLPVAGVTVLSHGVSGLLFLSLVAFDELPSLALLLQLGPFALAQTPALTTLYSVTGGAPRGPVTHPDRPRG